MFIFLMACLTFVDLVPRAPFLHFLLFSGHRNHPTTQTRFSYSDGTILSVGIYPDLSVNVLSFKGVL